MRGKWEVSSTGGSQTDKDDVKIGELMKLNSFVLYSLPSEIRYEKII